MANKTKSSLAMAAVMVVELLVAIPSWLFINPLLSIVGINIPMESWMLMCLIAAGIHAGSVYRRMEKSG